MGDGNLTMTWSSKNAYYVFTQTIFRFKYLWFVFNNLQYLCYSMPKLGSSNGLGKTSYYLQVHIRSYPFLSELYESFYLKDSKDKKIKVISSGIIIFYWLSAISLTYWATGDRGNTSSIGAWRMGHSGFYLHTKGFSFSDVYYLVGLIYYKFDIVCTVQIHENRPVLYITSNSKDKFIKLIYPNFHERMFYKLK